MGKHSAGFMIELRKRIKAIPPSEWKIGWGRASSVSTLIKDEPVPVSFAARGVKLDHTPACAEGIPNHDLRVGGKRVYGICEEVYQILCVHCQAEIQAKREQFISHRAKEMQGLQEAEERAILDKVSSKGSCGAVMSLVAIVTTTLCWLTNTLR